MRSLARSFSQFSTANFPQFGLHAVRGPTTGISQKQMTYLQQMNERLASEESKTHPLLVQRIQERLNAFKDRAPLSEGDIALGLQRMEQALRTSPMQIGFVCGPKLFDGPDAFFAKGVYENRYVRAGQSEEVPAYARTPICESLNLGREYPVHAPLNFSLRGHKGWGGSCLVLRPHLLEQARLSSRDTGDFETGAFAKHGTHRHLLPIIGDWVGRSSFPRYWDALSGPERGLIPWDDVTFTSPVEASILTFDGRLHPHDIAMVCVDGEEFEKLGRNGASLDTRRDAIRRFEGESGIPVVFRPEGAYGESFLEVPGYKEVVADYRERFKGLNIAETRPEAQVPPEPSSAPSTPPHYTQILLSGGSQSSPSPSSPHHTQFMQDGKGAPMSPRTNSSPSL